MRQTGLTGLSFALLSTWQVLGIAGVIYSPLMLAYVGLPIVFCLMLYIDYKSLPTKDDFFSHVNLPNAIELEKDLEIEVQIDFGGIQRSRDKVEMKVNTVPAFALESAFVPAIKRKGPGFTFRFPVTALKLSVANPLEFEIRLRSAGGLFWRHYSCNKWSWPAVIPSQTRVPEQEFERLMQFNRALFQGARIKVHSRRPDQFHSVRKYQYPDSFRFIDHKKSARYGELLTRTFDSLDEHHLVIGLDIGRTMMGRIGLSEKRAYYLTAVTKYIEQAIASRDRVSFFAFANNIPLIIRRSRNIHDFQPVLEGRDIIASRPEETDYQNIQRAISSMKTQRSAIVILTDASKPSVQQAIYRSMYSVATRHLSVVVSLVDKEFDIDERIAFPPKEEDRIGYCAKNIYSYWLRDEYDRFSRQMASIGSGVVSVPETYWIDMVSRTYDLMRLATLR